MYLVHTIAAGPLAAAICMGISFLNGRIHPPFIRFHQHGNQKKGKASMRGMSGLPKARLPCSGRRYARRSRHREQEPPGAHLHPCMRHLL